VRKQKRTRNESTSSPQKFEVELTFAFLSVSVGASKEFPENTLAAFEGAIREGSEAIESGE